VNEKEKRLAAWCRAKGVDGVWLRRRTNIAWLTDGADVHVDNSSSTGIASLLWTSKKKIAYTTNIEGPRLAAEELPGWEIVETPWWKRGTSPQGNVASDFPDDPFADLRSPLTALELKRVRALGKAAAAALAGVMTWARRGMTEHAIAGELAGRLRKDGIFAPVLLVAADERVRKFRHPIPTSARVRKYFMVALCPRQHGLMVAMTRIAHFGKLPAELRRRHDAVCRVDAALHAATKVGARWCDILGAGIDAYRAEGFGGEWKLHHQGGPVGYEGREFKATPTETRTVVRNQLVGWNPSIAGTKSEDTILSSGELLTGTRGWPSCGGRPDILLR
jgi:Xaa-Pro aminopeptidase